MKTNVLTVLLSLGFSCAYAQNTILHCASLIDGIGNAPRKNVSVIITGNQISDVKEGFVNGTAQDKVIDLRKQTVTPGWMDMHVHMESETNKNAYTEKFTM